MADGKDWLHAAGLVAVWLLKVVAALIAIGLIGFVVFGGLPSPT
jgi:hypothetical protein